MFSVTMSRAFTDSMAEFTGKMLNDAVERLASKYGFDQEEAKEFLLSGGVHVKLPILDKAKLPWCGTVDALCCKAIQKNGGLFTQCTNTALESGWCKKCAKEVEKRGTPPNGDVEARLAVDIMTYKVDKTEVKPYIHYMEKNGITREQVEESAREHGLTIDPRQFEKKKRGRKTTTPHSMEAVAFPQPAGESIDESENESENSEPEGSQESSGPSRPSGPAGLPRPSRPAGLPEFVELVEEPQVITSSNRADASDREIVPDDKALSISQINGMKKEEVHDACRKYGIDIGTKNILDLKKELKTKVK